MSFTYAKISNIEETLVKLRRAELRRQFCLFADRHLDDIRELTDGEQHNLTLTVHFDPELESSSSELHSIK